MGTDVHRVLLELGLPWLDELGWRFCVCIWYIWIWTWFSLMFFLILWFSTLVGACLLRIPCPHVGYHDVLSPIEVVQLDLLQSIVLDVWHCIRYLNVSVDLSLKLFHLPLWRVTIWQCSRFLVFAIKYLLLFAIEDFFAVCYRLGNIREAFILNKLKQNLACLLDLACYEGTLLLRLDPDAAGNKVPNSIEVTVLSPFD